MKVLMFCLVMLLFCACSSPKKVVDGKLISEGKILNGKTGFVSVLETIEKFEKSDICKSVAGVIILGSDSSDYEIYFYPNKVFAAIIPPGLYRVKDVKYECKDHPQQKSIRGFFVQEADENKFFIKIPHDGFCKLDFWERRDSFLEKQGK